MLFGMTPLVIAVRLDDPNLVRRVLRKGARPNDWFYSGYWAERPLYYVKSFEVIFVLLAGNTIFCECDFQRLVTGSLLRGCVRDMLEYDYGKETVKFHCLYCSRDECFALYALPEDD